MLEDSWVALLLIVVSCAVADTFSTFVVEGETAGEVVFMLVLTSDVPPVSAVSVDGVEGVISKCGSTGLCAPIVTLGVVPRSNVFGAVGKACGVDDLWHFFWASDIPYLFGHTIHTVLLQFPCSPYLFPMRRKIQHGVPS